MADQLQLRGGTTAQTNVFTGAQREVTVDTDLNTLVVHNGITPGGFPMASRDQVSNGTFYFNDNTGGGSAANAYILAAKSNTNRPTQYLDGIQLGFVTANANGAGGSNANFTGLGVKSIKYPGGIDPAPGDIFGRVYLIYDQTNDWLELQRKAIGPPPQIRTVSASVSGSALTVILNPATIDFRSPTLFSGTVNSRTFTSPLTITAPSGATLGTTSGIASRIVILAVDNAGIVSLALVNQTAPMNFDETTLINTVAISAGSTSANVVYGVANASGLPFRVVGVTDSTQATAGVWTTVPSLVQGQGGQAIFGLTKLVAASAQNTTSGTSIDFTSIPAGVKRVTLIANQVSTNAISTFLIQLGAGSVEVTGYSGVSSRVGASAVASTISTAGFPLVGAAANDSMSGAITFHNITGNIWIASGSWTSVNNVAAVITGGAKSLSGTLDRIRLTTVGGADVFDSGSINIFYEG